jgi:transposase
MKPYSKDLRLRILAAVDRGMSRKEVARTFGVSEPTIRRYLGLRRQSGGVDPRPPSGPPARKGRALEEAFSKLKALLRKVQARARGALLEAIGSALWAITARDAWG